MLTKAIEDEVAGRTQPEPQPEENEGLYPFFFQPLLLCCFQCLILIFPFNFAEGKSGPFIVSLEPAMAPMRGIKIHITGENFVKSSRVEIDGVPCKTRFISMIMLIPTSKCLTLSNLIHLLFCSGSDKLIVTSPPLQNDGLKDVEVINPDKTSHLLERVLLYNDEYFKLMEADKAKEKEKQTIETPEHDKQMGPIAIEDMVTNSSVPSKHFLVKPFLK